MELIQVIILGFIQGLTELWPISSSGHLLIVPFLAGFEDLGLTVSVFLHTGTLMALLIYFRKDLIDLFGQKQRRLRYLILIAIIPAVIGGLLLGDFAETVFRSPLLVAINLIVFGLILYWSDRQIRKYDLDDLNWSQALIIGLVQVLALVPGVSRSGITISAARFLGQKRDQAARFSFLMLIPVLIGATGLKIIEVNSVGLENTSVFAILVGLAVSFLTSYLALVYLFELLKRVGYWPFVVYRLVLGLIVLLLIYYL